MVSSYGFHGKEQPALRRTIFMPLTGGPAHMFHDFATNQEGRAMSPQVRPSKSLFLSRADQGVPEKENAPVVVLPDHG
jgi:hypothetical protein